MEFSGKRIQYEKNQIVEMICQLRFPAILSIDTREPADFQELVRRDYPRYAAEPEKPGAAGQGGGRGHIFLSEDGLYKLCLTRSFIALSTVRYTSWTDFARWLDEPLGHFISVYRPACFDRIGLRYINGFSRERLGLSECRWNELIAPQYLGPLALGETREEDIRRCSVDMESRLDERCSLKLHAGPGFIKRNIRTGESVQTVQEKQLRFILDMDLYSGGKIQLASAAGVMDAIHAHADRVFSASITDKLHEAMEPYELN